MEIVFRHPEQRSDAAIQSGQRGESVSGLLRYARNDAFLAEEDKYPSGLGYMHTQVF